MTPLPREEGTGLGPGQGYRAVDPGHTDTLGSRAHGYVAHNREHEHTAHEQAHGKWIQIHRPEENPASTGRLDTTADRPQGIHSTTGQGLNGYRP